MGDKSEKEVIEEKSLQADDKIAEQDDKEKDKLESLKGNFFFNLYLLKIIKF